MNQKTDQAQEPRLRLTLRQLEVFVATAHSGSTRGAAQRVARSQSAASAALAELEGALGAPLFERAARRLHLNEGGRALLPGAMALLEHAAELQALFNNKPALPLRIAASLTIAEYLLPERIGQWKAEHPEGTVHLTVGNSARVLRALVDREVDLGFVEGPQTHPALTMRRWLEDELVIVAAPSHPLSSGVVSHRLLNHATWILREPDSGTRQAADAWLLEHLGALQVAFELGSTEAIKRLAATGAGLACVSRHVVARELQDGTLVALRTRLPRSKRRLAIVTRREGRLAASAAAFLDLMRHQG